MRIAILLIIMSVALAANAQVDSNYKANSLYDAFAKGHVHGRLRSVYSNTINDGPLTDYYAVAAGGVLKYETASFHKFHVGIGGSFTYNVASSDLGKADPLTGAKNRYEVLLMDVQDPYNTNHMFRLDWLYLKYKWKTGYVLFGKQYILTPFINQQDLFMRSSVIDGLYGNVQLTKKIRLEAAYIYGISPSATVRWFSVAHSIGIFPKGVNPDGSPSNYTNNLHADGLGLIGLNYTATKNLKLQIWDQYVDQIFNTGLFQADYRIFLRNKKRDLLFAFQLVRQDPLASGGNTDIKKTYFSPNDRSLVFGGRVAYHTPVFDISANYTRINADGRYLMPREWGKEPMFTFLMREQIEGAGDVHAFSIRSTYLFKKIRLKADAGIGYYDMPAVTNTRLSKYGMPSFVQYCAVLRYSFNKALKGLDVEVLYLYKQKAGNEVVPEKNIINRVNMGQLSPSLIFTF